MYAPKNNYVLDFQLMEKAGNWLVYDIVVDGISLMGSYHVDSLLECSAPHPMRRWSNG